MSEDGQPPSPRTDASPATAGERPSRMRGGGADEMERGGFEERVVTGAGGIDERVLVLTDVAEVDGVGVVPWRGQRGPPGDRGRQLRRIGRRRDGRESSPLAPVPLLARGAVVPAPGRGASVGLRRRGRPGALAPGAPAGSGGGREGDQVRRVDDDLERHLGQRRRRRHGELRPDGDRPGWPRPPTRSARADRRKNADRGTPPASPDRSAASAPAR